MLIGMGHLNATTCNLFNSLGLEVIEPHQHSDGFYVSVVDHIFLNGNTKDLRWANLKERGDDAVPPDVRPAQLSRPGMGDVYAPAAVNRNQCATT